MDYQTLTKIELTQALKCTRGEPGLSLAEIASVMKEVLDQSELDSLIELLKDEIPF